MPGGGGGDRRLHHRRRLALLLVDWDCVRVVYVGLVGRNETKMKERHTQKIDLAAQGRTVIPVGVVVRGPIFPGAPAVLLLLLLLSVAAASLHRAEHRHRMRRSAIATRRPNHHQQQHSEAMDRSAWTRMWRRIWVSQPTMHTGIDRRGWAARRELRSIAKNALQLAWAVFLLFFLALDPLSSCAATFSFHWLQMQTRLHRFRY